MGLRIHRALRRRGFSLPRYIALMRKPRVTAAGRGSR
jgi:hypothetical protein